MGKMTPMMLVGNSVRAAAFSALRAGWLPWCLDCFADADLAERAPARRLRGRYPEAIVEESGDAPEGPWMYTGCLENAPEVLEALQTRRPRLWGADAATVRRVRHRQWLAEQCAAVGLAMPRAGKWPPGPGRWLVKPIASGGGQGIRPWADSEGMNISTHVHVQEWMSGTAVGVIFAGTTLLGATEQLVGVEWLRSRGFQYAGSVGPIALPGVVQTRLHALAKRLDLPGLFGIDGLLEGERFTPLEVNPRYTASVEVLEMACDFSALQWHRAAFEPGVETPKVPRPRRCVAKGILYAAVETIFPEQGPWSGMENRPVTELLPYADVPGVGERIAAGAPLFSVFAQGQNRAEALSTLHQRVRECQI
jgi:predicted ATP-grasp superfamily ATP-dependent carboligase